MSVDRSVMTELTDGVLVVTLDQPAVLNSFDDVMLEQLGEAFRGAQSASDVRAVVLTGRGRAFCAGANLRATWGEHSQIMGLRKRLNPVILSIAATEKPVICAVNGVVAGAGLGLMGVSDYRVASATATFVPATSRIGLAPDGGMSYSIPRLIGPGRAFHWLTAGETIDGATALSWGLVDELATPDTVVSRALAIARSVASAPPVVTQAVKRLLRAADQNSLPEQLELEARLQDLTERTAT